METAQKNLKTDAENGDFLCFECICSVTNM